MSFNAYRDEAARFLADIHADGEPAAPKLRMLQEELDCLKAADPADVKTISHQTYDLLFLLMEIAAQYHVDLDAEWAAGRVRKQEKYLQ